MGKDAPARHEIVIEDPLHLSGRSTHDFVESVLALSSLNWVYFRGLDGAFCGLAEPETNILPVRDFLPLLVDATQYDWGYLFFSDLPIRYDPESLTDAELLFRSDLSIFLVDDSYFFVYTDDEDVAIRLARDANTRQVARKRIDSIVIPS